MCKTNVEYPTSDSDKSGIDIGSKQAQEATGVVIFSFFIMACVYIMYFNGHMSEEGKHALDNPGSPGGVVWYIFHVPLGYSLLLVGVVFKYMIYMDEQNFLNPAYMDNGILFILPKKLTPGRLSVRGEPHFCLCKNTFL